MAWYLDCANTDIITGKEIKEGDIITLNLDPDHGVYVTAVCNARRDNYRQIRCTSGRRSVAYDAQIRRLRKGSTDRCMKCRLGQEH